MAYYRSFDEGQQAEEYKARKAKEKEEREAANDRYERRSEDRLNRKIDDRRNHPNLGNAYSKTDRELIRRQEEEEEARREMRKNTTYKHGIPEMKFKDFERYVDKSINTKNLKNGADRATSSMEDHMRKHKHESAGIFESVEIL